jgi:hypothetical protein
MAEPFRHKKPHPGVSLWGMGRRSLMCASFKPPMTALQSCINYENHEVIFFPKNRGDSQEKSDFFGIRKDR